MTYRVSSAHEEGGERMFAVSTERFEGDADGHVRSLHLLDVEFVDGSFQPVAGSERSIPADTVLLAMGFTGPEQGPMVQQFGVPLTERGAIVRDDEYATELDGVFVAGDAGRGQSLIVWAIAEGRAAAASVDRYLMGGTNLPSPIRASARPLMV
jgi:glutamate synthase (NADPH/NADH) small chain